MQQEHEVHKKTARQHIKKIAELQTSLDIEEDESHKQTKIVPNNNKAKNKKYMDINSQLSEILSNPDKAKNFDEDEIVELTELVSLTNVACKIRRDMARLTQNTLDKFKGNDEDHSMLLAMGDILALQADELSKKREELTVVEKKFKDMKPKLDKHMAKHANLVKTVMFSNKANDKAEENNLSDEHKSQSTIKNVRI